MEIIKRILVVVVCAFCFAILVITAWLMPIRVFYAIVKWIITGVEEDDNDISKPIDWVLTLPEKIIKKYIYDTKN